MKKCREDFRRLCLRPRREQVYQDAWVTEGSIERMGMEKSSMCTLIERSSLQESSATVYDELDEVDAESDTEFDNISKSKELNNLDNEENDSALLRLPLEIKNMIYTYYFHGQSITVRLSKTTSPLRITKFKLDNNNNTLAILLVCREMHIIAKAFIFSSEIILDIRRYRPFFAEWNILEYILLDKPKLKSQCSKLVISEDQFSHLGRLRQFPRLANIEVHDHKACRDLIPFPTMRDPENFAQHVPSHPSPTRFWHLKYVQQTAGLQVSVQMYCYCDFLICLTKDKNRKVDKHVTDDTTDRDISHTPKLARLRHTFFFSTQDPHGKYIGKNWVTTDLFPTPVSFDQFQAFHLHKYCQQLRKSGNFPPSEPAEKFRVKPQNTISHAQH